MIPIVGAAMLYLHEMVEIRGDGATAYMQAVVERARHSEANGISRLVATWRVIGSTHRWPRVVNLWEMDGWHHWSQSLSRQFDPYQRDAHLGKWWAAMVRYRRGGFDRILEPASFCPSRTQLAAQGVKGWVTEQQLYRLHPSIISQFLDEVQSLLLPAMASYAISLVGAYTAPMRPGEVLLLWSARDFATLCQQWAERTNAPRWRAWSARLNHWRVRREVSWLVPFTGTLLSPEVPEHD